MAGRAGREALGPKERRSGCVLLAGPAAGMVPAAAGDDPASTTEQARRCAAAAPSLTRPSGGVVCLLARSGPTCCQQPRAALGRVKLLGIFIGTHRRHLWQLGHGGHACIMGLPLRHPTMFVQRNASIRYQQLNAEAERRQGATNTGLHRVRWERVLFAHHELSGDAFACRCLVDTWTHSHTV